jgi:outer membrane protein assembly factor BamB
MKILLKTVCPLSFWFAGISLAQTATPTTAGSPSNAPAVLPGRGLAEHDFFYAGEAKEERMFIVRDGKVAWSYTHPGRGEISDAVLQPNGNILFAHQYGVTEVSTAKQVVWNYDAPANAEIHTAMPFGTNSVWFVQNSDPAKFVVLNKASGKVEREFVLPVKNPKSIHGHFRHARMSDAGTLLVAHMDLGKAAEYDLDGKELWSLDVPGIWSATPLEHGNLLLVSNRGFVREVNRAKETIWEWTPTDAPGYKFSNLQLAVRLPNGNTIINDWFNQWSGNLDTNNPPVQAIEVTPTKQVVWALRSWTPPADLGPATTIQILPARQKTIHQTRRPGDVLPRSRNEGHRRNPADRLGVYRQSGMSMVNTLLKPSA